MSRSGAARAVAAAALALAAGAARADGTSAELPLGPWVRAGRPVVVRAPGADRVRGGGSPWALPQGDAGDEFVLHLPRADVTLRDVEIDADGAIERRPLDVRALPAEGRLTAVFAPGGAAPGTVVVPVRGLPTVREAWLLFDDAAPAPSGLDPAAARGLDAWRAGPRSGSRAAFEPLLHPPGAAAFRATAEAAAAAPRVPRDAARALVVAGCVELFLLVLLRSAGARRRAAWLAVPPLACAAWLLASGRLPGPLRATVCVWEDDGDRLVVARFDGGRGGEASFRVPPGASTPALLAFDGDDRSAADGATGRDVRIPVPAGQSRVVAWRVPGGGAAAGSGTAGPAAARPAEAAWLAGLGLAVTGDAEPVPDAEILGDVRGFVPVRAVSRRVGTRK